MREDGNRGASHLAVVVMISPIRSELSKAANLLGTLKEHSATSSLSVGMSYCGRARKGSGYCNRERCGERSLLCCALVTNVGNGRCSVPGGGIGNFTGSAAAATARIRQPGHRETLTPVRWRAWGDLTLCKSPESPWVHTKITAS